MRRSIILTTTLAMSIAVLGACEPKAEVPKPPPTPVPTATASPSPLATASPTGTPADPGKKGDAKNAVKEAKPSATETPRSK